MDAGTLLRDARRAARLSQAELARRAGVAQSVISAYETGHREPSLPTLERLVAATGGRLKVEVEAGAARGLPDTPLGRRLRQRRRRVLDITDRYGITNVRIFGSVARGEDDARSDVDLLVDLPSGMGMFHLMALELELEDVLGAPVDVVPSDGLKQRARPAILRDAVPL